jgi:hypothetical protein
MSHAYSLHDTLIHVPMIVRYPALFPPRQRSRASTGTSTATAASTSTARPQHGAIRRRARSASGYDLSGGKSREYTGCDKNHFSS